MKQRGSALIFVLAMVFSITSMVLVTAAMTRSVSDRNEISHRSAQEKLSLAGSKAFVLAKSKDDSIALGSNYTVNIAGENFTVRAADSSAVTKRTYAVSITGSTRSKSTAMTGMTGTRRTSHPLYYALWVGGTLNDSGSKILTVNTDNGFVYANIIAKTGTATLSSDVVYGTSSTVATVPYGEVEKVVEPFFSFRAADYSAALPLPILTSSLPNPVLGLLSGLYYPTFYREGKLDVSGTITGTGIIFVNGDLTVTANLAYALASTRVVFVVSGDMTVSPTVTDFVGHFYVAGKVDLQQNALLKLNRGTIACAGDLTYREFTVTPDPYFLNEEGEAAKYRMPGFWPTPDPRLVRP